MRELDDLRRGLIVINNDALRNFSLGPSPLAAASAYAASKLRPSRPVYGIPEEFLEKLQRAIDVLRNEPAEMDFRTLRIICYGACTTIGNEQVLLIADEHLFRLLLVRVATYIHEPRRFRRLYFGLLSAYLSLNHTSTGFDTSVVKRANDELRAFLTETLDHCHTTPPIDWVEALVTYPEILSLNPGKRFASGLLNNDAREFEDVSRRLGISGTCWVAADIFRVAVIEAASKSDNHFVAHLPTILSALNDPRYQALQDETLALLLNRYGKISTPVVHPELRDAVVRAWKNPWLRRNEAAWGRVTAAARQMVAGWLKLKLIHHFFEIISEEGRQDKSRFEFWRDYHEHMDDICFAVGSIVYRSKNPDIEQLKHDFDGRLYELTGPDPETNAFIMFLGDVVVVEFSKKGNAAYWYDRSDIQLNLEQNKISIRALKQSPPGVRSTHHQGWQQLFAKDLTSHSKFRMVKAPVDRRGQIEKFAAARGINVDDKTEQGGNVWLLVDDVDSAISTTLKALGLSYKPNRGWWWRAQS